MNNHQLFSNIVAYPYSWVCKKQNYIRIDSKYVWETFTTTNGDIKMQFLFLLRCSGAPYIFEPACAHQSCESTLKQKNVLVLPFLPFKGFETDRYNHFSCSVMQTLQRQIGTAPTPALQSELSTPAHTKHAGLIRCTIKLYTSELGAFIANLSINFNSQSAIFPI